MKKIGFVILMVVFSVLTGCIETDLDGLRKDIADQEARLAALETWQSQANTNIIALQNLLNAQQQGKSIISVITAPEGYTIKLSDGTEFVIRHGGKGESAPVPVIGVRDSTDGNYYWTINGDLLRDTHGEPVRANGQKGETGDAGGQQGDKGEPGITPQIRINSETNEWEISMDKGISWVSTGVKATGGKGDKGDPATPGSSGDAIFDAENGVVAGSDNVTFKLANGTTFSVPLCKPLSLSFDGTGSYGAGIGQRLDIGFTISGTLPSNIKVYAAGNAGWDASAELTNISERKGLLHLTAPAQIGKSEVLIFLSDGAGQTWTYSLAVMALPVAMIQVPGGSLRIIGNAGRGWSLTDYLLSRTEVTNQQYCSFLNSLSPIPKDANTMKTDGVTWFSATSQIEYDNGRWQPLSGPALGATGDVCYGDYPMTSVSWYGAKAYCEWAGGELPTQAQMEYAARGSEKNTAGYNQLYAGSNTIGDVAWYQNNSAMASPVATKAGNYLGLYDLSGNAAEWCKDRSNDNSFPYPSNGLNGTQADPQGGASGTYGITYGGSWGSQVNFCQVDFHSILWADSRDHQTGFRLAYSKK